MKASVAPILILALAAIFALGPARPAQAQGKCEELYGAWYQYLERERCLREWRRTEKLRVCIAEDYGRMEGLARKIRDEIKPTMFLRDAKEVMEKTLDQKLAVIPAKGEPRGTMIETTITSNCATPFQLTVQVRALESEELVHVKFWSRFAPAGYQEGLRADLSRDFDDSQRAETADKRGKPGAGANREPAPGEGLPRKREPGARSLHEQASARPGRGAEGPGPGLEGRRTAGGTPTQPWAFAAPPPKNDHCAPNLSRKERIWRLQRFGLVRQTGPDTFRVKGHILSFGPKSDSLLSCD